MKEMFVYDITIDEDMMQQAEAAALRQMKECKERAALLSRLIPFEGRYVTKRLEPEFAAAFPEFPYVRVGKRSSYCPTLCLHLSNSGNRHEEFDLASPEDRRVSLDMIKRQMEAEEKEAQEYADALSIFRENAAQWNNLMAYAATLYGPIYTMMGKCRDWRADRIRRL